MIATLLKHEYLRTRTLLGLLLGGSLAVVGFETNFADAFVGEGNDDVMPLGFLPYCCSSRPSASGARTPPGTARCRSCRRLVCGKSPPVSCAGSDLFGHCCLVHPAPEMASSGGVHVGARLTARFEARTLI